MSEKKQGGEPLSAAKAFHEVSRSVPSARRRKAPPPFSLRLTAEERTRLDRDAGTMPLGAYIRSRLFDGPATARRSQTRRPVKDEESLARVLAALGQSRFASNLNQLAKAANAGVLRLAPEDESRLRESCEAVKAIRHDLMAALGLDPGARP